MKLPRLAAKTFLVLLGLIAVPFALYLGQETRGVGSFRQQVYLESSKPIKAVSYCCWDVNDETRRLAESTPDPFLFDFDQTIVADKLFTANIGCTNRTRPFIGCEVFYPAHLVLLAEFKDGTRAYRIVDLPSGCGKQAITVNFD